MHSRRLVGALQTKADYPVHVLLPGNPKKSCTGRRAFRHPCTARGGGHGGVGVARLACSRSIDANPRACATPRRWRAAIAATPRAARRLYRSPTCGRSLERPFPLRGGEVYYGRPAPSVADFQAPALHWPLGRSEDGREIEADTDVAIAFLEVLERRRTPRPGQQDSHFRPVRSIKPACCVTSNINRASQCAAPKSQPA